MKKLLITLALLLIALCAYAYDATHQKFTATVSVSNAIVAIPSSVFLQTCSMGPYIYNGSSTTATIANVTFEVATPNIVAFKTSCSQATIKLTPKVNATPTVTVTATVTH